MAKDLSQTVANWTNGAGAAGQKFADGVANSNVDVVGRAIAAQGALLSNFTQSVGSGRWAAKLRAKGNDGWKRDTLAKQANYAVGVAAGADNYAQSMSTWLPVIHSAAASARSMPSGSIAASNARSAAFATALYNRKRGSA